MYFTIEKIYNKTTEQDWSGVIINTERSMSSTFDERDNDSKKIISDEEKSNHVSKFVEIVNELGDDYVGWDKEYVDNNQLKIIYSFRNIESAKMFYIKSNKTHDMYEVKWRLVNPVGYEIFSKP